MPSTIEIDDEVYARLGTEAIPFVETTPNAVLRRLLGIDHATNGSSSSPSAAAAAAVRGASRPASSSGTSRSSANKAGKRATRGTLLPKSAYEVPILRALDAAGGRAPSREVVAAVGAQLADQLTDADREELRSGEVRWENRVHFTRLSLVEQGLLDGNAPRGTWEISEAGRQRVADES